MPRPLATVLALTLITGLACAGLTPAVSGELTVDGAPFVPASCRSGVPLGFTGVALLDAQGRKIHLAARPDGTADVVWFNAPHAEGVALGACAAMTLEASPLTVADVEAVKGHATLGCQGEGPALVGEVSFDRCAVPLRPPEDPSG